MTRLEHLAPLCGLVGLMGALGDWIWRVVCLREGPGVADGLAELEVQGDKDLKVRFYNIEDALDEKSWIAGIISETFGRKVGISVFCL